MWERRAIAVGILSTIFMLMAIGFDIHDGKGLHEFFNHLAGSIFLSMIIVYWFTRDMDSDGHEHLPSLDDDISKLQKDLRVAVQNAAYNDAKGELSRAAYWHLQAAVLQSRLRNHGA